MLLEINWKKMYCILNTDKVHLYFPSLDETKYVCIDMNMGTENRLVFDCENMEEQYALYNGLKLALTGLDFVYGDTGFYIKKLLSGLEEETHKLNAMRESLRSELKFLNAILSDCNK